MRAGSAEQLSNSSATGGISGGRGILCFLIGTYTYLQTEHGLWEASLSLRPYQRYPLLKVLGDCTTTPHVPGQSVRVACSD